MNKHKLFFFIESLSGGGAEQVLVTMLRHFDYEKYDVTVLTMTDVGVHLDDIDFNKVHYQTVIPKHSGTLAKLWYAVKYKLLYQYFPSWLVARLIIPSGYDTYIAFIEGYCTKIISELSATHSKLITYVHIDLKNYPWTQNLGIFKSLQEEIDAYKRFDTAVCVSRSVEDIMKTHYGLTNTTTIYNPIDIEYICKKAQEPVDFKPADGFNIVSVGRLVPQKGYDLLIPIIARLRSEGLNVNLYILGEGEDRQKLESLNFQVSAFSYIHLLGYHNNPHAIVSKMDLFVCSSRAEGYSLVIAEALSMGIPVISTNCSGPNELLANGNYGILCDDYEQLYEKMKAVITTPELQEELHQKALKRRETLGVENTLRQLESLL